MDTPMTDVATPQTSVAPVESSTATTAPQVPTDEKSYREWRETGRLPGDSKPKAESAPAKQDESSEPSDSDGEHAPAPEAGKDNKQEKANKPRSNAETRLKELLDDLKRAGLSPAELKSFKKQAQQAAEAETPKPEHTEKPAQTQGPQFGKEKPALENFDSIEQFVEALSDYKAEKREFERSIREAQQHQQKEINDKLTAARARYGEDADTTIS
jgi:hypothetical protein